MLRRIPFLLCALAGGLAGACVDLAEDLDGEPCTVEDDCWHTQECARTIEEIGLALPGVCKPKGTGCVLGQQLGCSCTPMDANLGCFQRAVATPFSMPLAYPTMTCDAATLKCVVMPPEETP